MSGARIQRWQVSWLADVARSGPRRPSAFPGAYIMLGAGRGAGDAGVHHPRYDFNDDILPVGASYWAALAEQLLPRTA